MQLSRRATLVLGVGGAALTVLGWNGRAQAGAKEAAEQIAKFTGGKTATQGKISIELPEIAENGNTVPLSVAVDAPMTADNYVSEVMVVAEGNPNPGVATFHFQGGPDTVGFWLVMKTQLAIGIPAGLNKGIVFVGTVGRFGISSPAEPALYAIQGEGLFRWYGSTVPN